MSDTSKTFFEEGKKYSESENYEEAIKSFQKSIEIDPDFQDAYSEMGYALGNVERYDEALNSFEKALKIQST
ncbi:MAG: tetratricopeptide repeat protein, partial [Methanobacteriaceae archaeon]|nr:tetratricopeptide repeat protein [Methanobacteriaceae archaeon]